MVNNMYGFSILMFIFGIAVLFVGLYMFKGHKLGIMTLRPAFKNLKKEDWMKIGKYTMIVSLFIFMLAIVGLIFNF